VSPNGKHLKSSVAIDTDPRAAYGPGPGPPSGGGPRRGHTRSSRRSARSSPPRCVGSRASTFASPSVSDVFSPRFPPWVFSRVFRVGPVRPARERERDGERSIRVMRLREVATSRSLSRTVCSQTSISWPRRGPETEGPSSRRHALLFASRSGSRGSATRRDR